MYDKIYRSFHVMASDVYPVNDHILDIIIDQITIYTTHSHKTFVVLFSMNFPAHIIADHSNAVITLFMDRFTKYLERRDLKPQYLWVREQNQSINHHYHCMLILDGNKIQNHYGIMQEAERIWDEINGCNASGLIHYGTSPFMLRRTDLDFAQAMQNCIYAASYLAKTRGKEHHPHRIRTYNSSRLC